MTRTDYHIAEKKVQCIFDASVADIPAYCNNAKTVVITDDNIYAQHSEKFKGFRLIRIQPGEQNKTQDTVDTILNALLEMEADKETFLVGAGGGMITDITGYVASIYKRGISCAFVPTTILGMVDASIGGKNGIDVGVYKNMIGTIRQPVFILYDYSFLQTLPVAEWVNGFAEIIKHACIKDHVMFSMLEKYSLHDLQADNTLIASIVERNVDIKMNIVMADEFENGERRLLNFGHTIGHAIENLHGLPHGHSVSIGMVAACNLSEQQNEFHFAEAQRVVKLLSRYHLPVDIETDYDRVFDIIKQDKKRANDVLHYVMLKHIGVAEVKPIALELLHQQLKNIL